MNFSVIRYSVFVASYASTLISYLKIEKPAGILPRSAVKRSSASADLSIINIVQITDKINNRSRGNTILHFRRIVYLKKKNAKDGRAEFHNSLISEVKIYENKKGSSVTPEPVPVTDRGVQAESPFVDYILSDFLNSVYRFFCFNLRSEDSFRP